MSKDKVEPEQRWRFRPIAKILLPAGQIYARICFEEFHSTQPFPLEPCYVKISKWSILLIHEIHIRNNLWWKCSLDFTLIFRHNDLNINRYFAIFINSHWLPIMRGSGALSNGKQTVKLTPSMDVTCIISCNLSHIVDSDAMLRDI